MEVVVVIAVVASIVGAIAYAVHRYEKQRTQKINDTASQMGLEFYSADIRGTANRFSDLNLFSQGSGRKASNILFGETDEVSISIFDYQYTVGSGKQQSTPKQTVTGIESVRLRCPNFSMRPENLFDKFGSMLGFQDIDFENHAEFSSMFVLKGEDEAAIREFFTKDLLDFFAKRPGVSVEATHGRMICYRANQRQSGDQFPKLLEEAYQVFGMIVDRGT